MNKKEVLVKEVLESRKNLEKYDLIKIKGVTMECFKSLKTFIDKITNVEEEKEKINIVEDQLFLLNKYINLYNLVNSTHKSEKSEKTLQKIKNCILMCKNTIDNELLKIA